MQSVNMADEDYNRKLEELQRYIPFLENMIAQLKDPKKKNREAQLQKMESLHSMITDKKKKLKLETLKKCEEVILKIYEKVTPAMQKSMDPRDLIKFTCRNPPDGRNISNEDIDRNIRFQAARARLNELNVQQTTPASPSPPKEIPILSKPKLIPTEKVINLSKFNANEFPVNMDNNFQVSSRARQKLGGWSNRKCELSEERYESDRPNIYSCIAESLQVDQNSSKKSIFERLGTKLPDMSKPLLSDADLESLTATTDYSIDAETLSLTELQDLREQLKKQLKVKGELAIKKSASDKCDKEQSNKSKSADPVIIRPVPPPLNPKLKVTKAEKVIVDPDTIFGSQLSSIDKILGDTIKKKDKKDHKKDEKKPTETKKDEKHPKSSESKKENEKKDEKIDKDMRDDKKVQDKERMESKKDRDSRHKDEKRARDSKEEKKEKHHQKSADKNLNSGKKKESGKHRLEKSKDSTLDPNKKHEPKTSEKSGTPAKSSNVKDTKNSIASAKTKNESETTPVHYKRLADKYNPKPRKPSVDAMDVDKKVVESIQKSMETSERLKSPPLVSNEPKPGMFSKLLVASPVDHSWTNNFDTNRIPQQIVEDYSHISSLITDRNAKLVQSAFSQLNSNAADKQNLFVPQFQTQFSSGNFPTQQNLIHQQIPQQIHQQIPQQISHQISHQIPQQISQQQHPILPLHNEPLRPNRFGPSQSINQVNMVNQTVANHGNTFLNTFIVQRNDINTVSHNQYRQTASNQHSYGSHVPQNKGFTPFASIGEGTVGNNDTYDISKMSPTDFFPNSAQRNPQTRYENAPGRNQYMHNSNQRPPYHNKFNQRDSGNHDPRDPRRYQRYREEVPHDRDERFNYNKPVREDPRIRSRMDRCSDPKSASNNQRDRSNSYSKYSSDKYDKMYSTIDRTKEQDSFTSPLDSLYTATEGPQKTGKGYGFQKFKIPKRRKPENDFVDDHAFEENFEEASKVEDESESRPVCKTSVESDDESNKTVQRQGKVDTKEESTIENSVSTDAKAATLSNKVEETDVKVNEPAAPVTDQMVLTNFFTNYVKKSDQKVIWMTLLDALADNLSDQQIKKFKRIQRIVDDSSDEEQTKEDQIQKTAEPLSLNETKEEPLAATKEAEKEIKDPVISEKTTSKDVVEPEHEVNDLEQFEDTKILLTDEIKSEKKMVRRGKRGKRGRKAVKAACDETKNVAKEIKSEPVAESLVQEIVDNQAADELVVESVGERIKNRRRNAKTEITKPRKCRSELDMLHEDIKEMFICDGVLTATGKRMCRILKDDPDALSNVESTPVKKKVEVSTDEEDKPITRQKKSLFVESSQLPESPKRKAKLSIPRVVIEKSDFTKLLPPKPVDDDSTSEAEPDNSQEIVTKSKSEGKVLRSKIVKGSPDSPKKSPPPKRKALRRQVKQKPIYTENESDEEPSLPVSDVEEAVDDESQNDAATKKIMKKRKRGHTWAMGVIKKKKKGRTKSETSSNPDTSFSVDDHETSYLSESDTPSTDVIDIEHVDSPSESSDVEYIEPDKNYYYDPTDKPSCKLCKFKGKMIVQHYKSAHPKEDVQISRVSPEASEEAIKEAIKNDYDGIIAVDMLERSRRKKFTYQCLFCKAVFKNENTESFYDHITSHTGEFRYPCSLCPYQAFNNKCLRSHIHFSHKSAVDTYGSLKPIALPPPNFQYLFGYICSACNFIQTKKATVENHVKIYHIGKTTIYKINLSLIVPKEEKEPVDTVESEDVKDEQYENIMNLEKAISELQKGEALSVSLNMEKETTEAEEKTVVEETDQNSKQKEQDTNIFMCNTDTVEQDQKIEEQRLRKMKEISQAINQKRSSLSFTDQLKNRLQRIISVDDVVTESQPQPNTSPSTSIGEKLLKVPLALESKKTVMVPPKLTRSTEVGVPVLAKQNAPISSIIQRLTSQLSTENEYKINEKVDCDNEDKDEKVEDKDDHKESKDIVEKLVDKDGDEGKGERKGDGKNVKKEVGAEQNNLSDGQNIEKKGVSEEKLGAEGHQENLCVQNRELKPPPLIHVKELQSQRKTPENEDVVVRVGPFEARNKKNYVLYTCYMQSCSFYSTIQATFKKHFEEDHVGMTWDGNCETCGKRCGKLKASMEEAFEHLITKHSDYLELENDNGNDSSGKPYIRMRRLSGDLLSKSTPEEKKLEAGSVEDGESTPVTSDEKNASDSNAVTDVEPEAAASGDDDDVPVVEIPEDSEMPFKIIDIQTDLEETEEEPHSFPFQITNVTTLTPEEEEAAFNNQSTISVVNVNEPPPLITSTGILSTMTSSSPVIKLTTPPGLSPLTKAQKSSTITVPIIQNITSKDGKPVSVLNYIPLSNLTTVASTSSNTVLTSPYVMSPIMNTGAPKVATKKLILRDLLMTPQELTKPRKSASAMASMLNIKKLMHLYKCPEYNCYYSTDKKTLFESHLQNHKQMIQQRKFIPCLYCNYKTEVEFIVIHINVRHARSPFGCGYCFYRAVCHSYVEMHHSVEHPQMPVNVVRFAIVPQALVTKATITQPALRSILPPYICGQTDCSTKTLFAEDFVNHLKQNHPQEEYKCTHCSYHSKTAGMIKQHMNVHGVWMYHCRYCTFGGKLYEDVYKHLAASHFTCKPHVIRRVFLRDYTKRPSLEYKYEGNEIFNRLNHLVDEDKTWITDKDLKDGEDVQQSSPGKLTAKVKSIKSPECIVLSPVKNKGDENVVNDKDIQQPLVKSRSSLSLLKPAKDITAAYVASKAKENVANKSKDPIILNSFLEQPMEVYDEPWLDISSDLSSKSIDEVTDPLSLDTEPCITILDDEKDSGVEGTIVEANLKSIHFEDLDAPDLDADISIEDSGDETAKKENLSGCDLFKCAKCHVGFENSVLFKAHLIKCIEITTAFARPFKCAHCVKNFKNHGSLIEHVRSHGLPRLGCSLCEFKHQNQLYIRMHMKTVHKISNLVMIPIDPKKTNIDRDEFVAKPKLRQKGATDGSLNVSKDVMDDVMINTVFGPEDIDTMPRQEIFSQSVKCRLCEYSSRVRKNIVRHLQLHSEDKAVPVTAPVNPVPCLGKTEKMFDKMTNLANSSNVSTLKPEVKKVTLSPEEEAKLPVFIPLTNRYQCGAPSCSHLSLDEPLFRTHLQVFHSEESAYECIHCKERLSLEKGGVNIDAVVRHMRLHDLHLYKCGHCRFLHNSKFAAERHSADKHAGQEVNVITVREIEREPEDRQEKEKEEVKEAKPWRCGMCKYRCLTKNSILAHVEMKHNMKCQFKCALCTFKKDSKDLIEKHFDEQHSGQVLDIIDVFYNVNDKTSLNSVVAEPFDTTPLWQRDRPRIRHIRGILFDDTKMLKKSPVKCKDNLDKAIEAVATASSVKKDEPTVTKTVLPKKIKLFKEKKIEDVIKFEKDLDVLDLTDSQKCSTVKTAETDKKLGDDSKPILKSEFKEVINVSGDDLRVDDLKSLFSPSSGIGTKEDDSSVKDSISLDVKENFSADALVAKFGLYGEPFKKHFFCPFCQKFKTKHAVGITHHLYKELKYSRFVCTNCGLMGLTHKFLHRHSLQKHIGQPESIHPLTPDAQIESWVQSCVAAQRELILESPANNEPQDVSLESPDISASNDPERVESFLDKETESPDAPSTPEKADSVNLIDSSGKKLHPCSHCTYKTKNLGDLKKHEKRHWVEKPLKCGHCGFEGVTNTEISQHSRRAHKNLDVTIINVPMPSTPTIIPISRKRKNKSVGQEDVAKKLAVEVTSEEDRLNDSTSDADSSTILAGGEANDADDVDIFICYFCPKRTESIDEMKEHWSSVHKFKNYYFKYKTVRKSLVKKIKMNSNVLKCYHCNFMNYIDMLKKHHEMEHPNLKFIIYRYRCNVCRAVFKKVATVKHHFVTNHADQVVSYSSIYENRSFISPFAPSTSNTNATVESFACEHCGQTLENRKQLETHHSIHHAHLQFCLPPNLPVQSSSKLADDLELKKYRCSSCVHTSNSLTALREHVRNHIKPFRCSHCSQRFSYPSMIKTHHQKEHLDVSAEHKYEAVENSFKLLEDALNGVLMLDDKGEYKLMETMTHTRGPKRRSSDISDTSRKVQIIDSDAEMKDVDVKPIVRKPTARKSTTRLPQNVEGYSYYGTKPDIGDIKTIITTVPIMDASITMCVEQLANIFKLFPIVEVVDCNNHNVQL